MISQEGTSNTQRFIIGNAPTFAVDPFTDESNLPASAAWLKLGSTGYQAKPHTWTST